MTSVTSICLPAVAVQVQAPRAVSDLHQEDSVARLLDGSYVLWSRVTLSGTHRLERPQTQFLVIETRQLKWSTSGRFADRRLCVVLTYCKTLADHVCPVERIRPCSAFCVHLMVLLDGTNSMATCSDLQSQALL